MKCESCGSEKIEVHIETNTVHRILEIENGTLILEESPLNKITEEITYWCRECGEMYETDDEYDIDFQKGKE